MKMIETSSENAFENVRISRSALRNLLIIRLFFANTGCEMISISCRFLPKNPSKPIEQTGSVFIKNRSQPKPIETDCANTKYCCRSQSTTFRLLHLRYQVPVKTAVLRVCWVPTVEMRIHVSQYPNI